MPDDQLDETAAATTRYLEALTLLQDEDMRAPSLLPAWTRGHVVTHVSRNADGLRNLLVWARTGVQASQYPSWEHRNADIDSGSNRSSEQLRRDASDSSARFLQEAARLRQEHWDVLVRPMPGASPISAHEVLKRRRTEVEVHHADLGIGYEASDWPPDFTEMLISRVQEDRAEGPSMVLSSTDRPGRWEFGRDGGPEIKGTLADLVWWAIGRGDGLRLVSSTGDLPELERWR